ncbi:MAG: Ig-like domain-containing protein [Polyangiales bacterium]
MQGCSLTGGLDDGPPSGHADQGPGGDAGPRDTSVPVDPFVPPRDEAPPRVTITSPAEGASTSDGVTVLGTALDDAGVASVFVQVGPNAPLAAGTEDGFRTWSFSSAAPSGAYRITAFAYDNAGHRSDTVSVMVHGPSAGGGASAPSVTIVAPADGSVLASGAAVITGNASDDEAVVRMEVLRNGELLEERLILTDDFYASWARRVTLLPGQTNVFTFRAYDALGNVGEATLALVGTPEVDRLPPTLLVTAPVDGASIAAPSVDVRGSAMDRLGIREVKIQVGRDLTGDGEPEYGESLMAHTLDEFASFERSVDVPSGDVFLRVRAIDVSGVATTEVVRIRNTYVAEWAEEQRYPLFLRPTPDTTVRMELDRDGVNEVILPSIQAQTEILRLDPATLIRNALAQIKNACGTAWRNDAQNPQHDCTLTPLGRTFRGPNGTWQSSAEYALVRLLTMTPANVAVAGTSLEGLEGLAGLLSSLGLAGDFSDILAQTLGISRTSEIVGTEAVATAFQTGLLAPHPNTGPNGEMIITLYDAMNDLSSLGATLGPAGSHPGILAAGSTPYSEVFTDAFQMTIVAESNLRWRDGVDLSLGKEYIAIVEDRTGPSTNDVLEFDFNDPARFDVTGLTANPVVDLRIALRENARFIPACTGDGPCKTNAPSTPRGTQYVWSTPSWEAEYTVASAARTQYRTRVANPCAFSLFVCLARINVGQNGDPPGWADFNITLNLGNPPDEQFIWEMVSEVAQVALHRLPSATIPEGQANVAFTLEDIGVGMTAEEIRAAVRPVLQGQASTLSDMLLGDYAANNGRVDLFYARGADGVPTVYFAAAGDPRPGAPYGYARPGFFSDAALTSMVSTRTVPGSGDTEHEKLRLAVGESTVFAQDEDGGVYRLRFVVGADPTEIAVYVSRRTR